MGKLRKFEQWEVEKMVKMYESGESFAQISKKIGRHTSSVQNKLVKLGIHKESDIQSRKEFTDDEIATIERMYKKGNTMTEIGRKLGRDGTVVRRKLNSLGVYKVIQSRTVKEFTDDEINIMIKLYNGGESLAKIGKVLGCERWIIHNKLTALGIHKVKTREKENGKRIYLYDVEHLRSHIVDVDEAKQLFSGSNKKILFKCDNDGCIHTKKMTPNHLSQQGFACNICSKNISYGQLAFQSYQTHFKLGYEVEVVLKTLDNRRVDFVKFNDKGNVINFVEIQGRQHTEPSHQWYEDAHAQDIAKRKWAKATNTLMIEIDMRISSWEYFKEQINKCKYLPNINKNDEIAILKLMENNKRYPIKEIIKMYEVDKLSTVKIAEKYNVGDETIGNILRKQNIKTRGIGNAKRLRLIETNQVFKSIAEAQRKLNISSNISANLNGRQKSAGKHPITLDSLHWEYVSPASQQAIALAKQSADNINTSDTSINLDDTSDLSDSFMSLLDKEKV